MERENLKPFEPGSRMNAGMVAGLLIFSAGVVLLLDRMGVIDAGNLLRYWPVALVIFGLMKLFEQNAWGVRIQGLVLMSAGVLLLLTAMGILHVHFWDLWPLALIAAGLSMIFGGLDNMKASCWKKGSPASISRLNELAVFGGGERRINANDFEGGQLTAVFGGFKVDLTKASMKENQAIIDVSAIFGGGEVRIPEEWNVVMQSVGIFGGYSDATRHPKADDPTVKNLIVRGVAIFGGVEIRN